MSGENKTKSWVEAMRLRTLPLASAGIVTGVALASARVQIDWAIAGLTLATALSLQILSNLANDLGDALKGTDNDNREGPTRAVQSGVITAAQMKRAVILFAGLSLALGLGLLFLTFGNPLNNPLPVALLLIGLLGIGAAVNYTIGKRAYGYSGFGDLFVLIFFGLVAVGGSYLLQVRVIDWIILLPACAIGLFSVAVLNLNNMRDIENDKASGKITLPVRMGLDNAKTYHAGMILIAWMLITIHWMLTYGDSWSLIIFLPGFIFYKHIKFVLGNDTPRRFDPELKKVALGTFVISLAYLINALI